MIAFKQVVGTLNEQDYGRWVSVDEADQYSIQRFVYDVELHGYEKIPAYFLIYHQSYRCLPKESYSSLALALEGVRAHARQRIADRLKLELASD